MRAIGKADKETTTKMTDQIRSGKADDLINLIQSVISEDDIKSDSKFLADCTEDEFSKLLESRRSDRSKKLKDRPLSNVSTCTSYIGAMYAELLVRSAWNKPYASGTNEVQVDESDLDSVKRKIKSLQSKKCRLAKTAQYDENDQKELDAVNAEIARLSEFRPTIVSKSVVKSVDVETIRAALQQVQHTLSAEQLDQYKKAGLL
jgi:vacuolar-type H+-ATPase subunit I/STV1